MKSEIIPTILVHDRLEFERRLGIMEGQIPVAQMDVMDGKFVTNTTFTDPEIATHYKVDYELDLMVDDPEPLLDAWKEVPTVKRAFVHAEIKKPLAPLFKKIKTYGWEAGLSLNPDTPWQVVEDFLVELDEVLFMTVYPGQNAAPFQPQVLSKIKNFHTAHLDMPIEVDGGVNAQTLPLLVQSGATRFAVGSAIWSAPDPVQVYKQLLHLCISTTGK